MKITRKKSVKRFRIVEHNKRVLYWIIGLIVLLVIVICLIKYSEKREASNNKNIAAMIANPASVYCEDNNGTLAIKTDANGGQYGICTLKDGSQCDEWKYYRGECS